MKRSETETEFLTQIISYEDTSESQRLKAGITRAQQDVCCVRKALRFPVVLMLLAVAGRAYWEIFLEQPSFQALERSDITWSTLRFLANGCWGLGLGSLVSILVLFGLLAVYHCRACQQRREGRQFAAQFLQNRLGTANPR